MGDFKFPEEDKDLTEKELIEKILEDDNYKEQKKTIEKYITEFVKADLITQEIHRRRGFELTNKANSHDDWVDGGVYLFRTRQKGGISSSLEIDSDELVKSVNGTEYVQMQYVKQEEFNKLVAENNKKIRYRYTLDEDTGELLIAQVKTIEKIQGDISDNIVGGINSWFMGIQEWLNDKLGIAADSTEVLIEDIIRVDYKEYIQKYTMPYEFLINLCEITQNPEFVYHVAQLARETNILLAVQDDTTVEKIVTEEEKKYESYENGSSSSTSGAHKTGERKEKIRTVTITTTMVPHLQVEYANTWSFLEQYEYTKTITENASQNGPVTQPIPLPAKLPNYQPPSEQEIPDAITGGSITVTTPEKWSGTFVVEIITATETTVTTTIYNPGILKNSVEKSKQFLGLLRNSTGECNYNCDTDEEKAYECAKNAEFVRKGINVEYGLPNSTRTDDALSNLRSGEQMLYSLLGEGIKGDESKEAEDDNLSQYKVKMSGLVDHMKYLMTFPENENIDWFDTGLEDIITDEEYGDLNVDDIIVKTDVEGSLTPVTSEQLIGVINATFTGAEQQNALSLVNTLIDCQGNYKVNAIFVLAMAHNESHIGTANTSYVRNNNWLSWNLGATYSSPQENVETVMKSIANGSVYFSQGKITIKDIGYTYCPNTSEYPTQGDGWVRNVTSYVKNMYAKLGTSIEKPETGNQEQQGQEANGAYTVNGRTYPNYKQDSGAPWSSNTFADSTMKKSGCTLTSVAIILSGYGENVTPEDIRREVGGKITNLVTLIQRHGISCSRPGRVLTASEIRNHLQSGKPIIVNVKGEWTSSTGHYMVLLDYRNKDGVEQVYVSNPGTVNSTKNGWVNLSRISNNMKTASILITSD